MIENVLIFVFIILLLHYAYFLLKILSGLNNLSLEKNNYQLHEFISIIVPFRNESKNILKSLESLENQNYPKKYYEVIYVNDFSEDDSFEKLITKNKSDNIKLVSIPKDYSKSAFKKSAIKYGIEKSQGEIIVTTDADCVHYTNWLKSLLNTFDKDSAFISGPVEFIDDGNLFSKIQKLEFAGIILAGAGLIGNNQPVICNAANIAYRKNVYEELNGFDDQFHLSSGDDELLMQKIHNQTKYKVKFCLDENSIVRTNNNSSLKTFFQQRKRWASKSLFYSDKSITIKLILIFLFYLGLIVQIILSVFVSLKFVFLFLISFAAKILIEFFILKKGKKILFDSLELKYFFITEIFQIPYIIIAGISGLFGNYIWKERKVKR